jgi:plastocyanin
MLKATVAAVGIGVLLFAQLAFGGADQATTWTVYAGDVKKAPAGTPKGTQLNQFFPGRLTVNAGDKVTFSTLGFHTVSYLNRKAPPPFLLPAKGEVYSGINDAAGQPFYFDGESKFENNMVYFVPAGGTSISRGKFASSGAMFSENPRKPVTASFGFPQVGKFKLVCMIHPSMEMDVTVKPKGAAVPATPDEVIAAAEAGTAVAYAKAKRVVMQKPPRNTIYMGVDTAKVSGGRVTVFDFLPTLTTVKVGTPVRFVVKAPSEAHNAVFGNPKYAMKLIEQTDLFPEKPGDPNQATPFFLFGSDPPGTPYEGSKMHGNGFYATPLADGLPGPPPASFKVSFTTPGKYHFICQLHGPDMAADIRVTR